MGVVKCPTITKFNRKKINKNRPDREKKPSVTFDSSTAFTCQVCDSRACCRGLCPPMDWLVRQCEIEPSHETPSIDPASVTDTLQPVPWASSLSTKDLALKIFFMDNKSQTEIADTIGISRQYVNKILNNYEYKIVPKHHK